MEKFLPYITKIEDLLLQIASDKLTETQKTFLNLTTDFSKEKNREEVLELFPDNSLYNNIDLSFDIIETELKAIKAEFLNMDNSIKSFYSYNFMEVNKEIKLTLDANKENIPEEVLSLILEIEKVQHVIKSISKEKVEEEELDYYLKRLLGIAKVGSLPNFTLFAKDNLEALKHDYVKAKWWSKKLPFIKKFGKSVLYLLSISLLIIFILRFDSFNIHALLDRLNVDLYKLTNWFFILIGAATGSWLSFTVLNRDLSFEEFRTLSKSVTNPILRIGAILLVSSVFYLFFINGLINIEIGESEFLNTKYIGNEYHENFALFIGILLGISESTIGKSLYKKVDTITSKF